MVIVFIHVVRNWQPLRSLPSVKLANVVTSRKLANKKLLQHEAPCLETRIV